MRDQAIYATHPHVRTILEGKTALDADGKQVIINEALVKDEQTKLLRAFYKIMTKAESQRRIYAIAPQWRQDNLTARAVELAHKRLDLIALTPTERAELVSGFSLRDNVKSIRTASDLIEADIDAAADPASVVVATSPRWPA